MPFWSLSTPHTDVPRGHTSYPVFAVVDGLFGNKGSPPGKPEDVNGEEAL